MTQGQTDHPAGLATAPVGRLLFALLGGAGAWVLHFLGSYAVASIGCVHRWTAIDLSIAVATLVLAGLAAWSTLVARREWRRVSAEQSWDTALGEPRGWFAFLMLTGVLLGLVSVLTIVLEGWGTLLLPACGWSDR